MSYRIIAFDGGGVRGLVSALLLQNLEIRANLLDRTDMFGGTSTGSFLALGLAQDVTLEQIIALYKTKGAAIFDPAEMDWNCANPLTREQQQAYDSASSADAAVDRETIKSVFQAKYRPENLKAELVKLFGPGQLCELPLSGAQVVVNALQLWSESEGQWAPVSIGSGRNDAFRDMSLVDAALCSGAAPTYFPPHKPEAPVGQNWGYFADGGLFANNPSASAIAYAVEHFHADLAEMKVLSIGTGQTRNGIPPQDIGRADCWGAWQWLRPYSQHGGTVPAAPLIEAALSASASACGNYAKQMIGKRFLRADVDLEAAYALDDWRNVGILEEAVGKVVATPEWDELADTVAEYWDAPDDLAVPAKAALSSSNRSWFSTLFRN